MGEDTTGEVGAQLALDEARQGMIALAGASQEGLEVLPHSLVEKRLLGTVRDVGG